MNNFVPLNTIPLGIIARVKGLSLGGNTRRKMLDLGLVTDTTVQALYRSPSGDPTAYHIRGAVIALRSEEASKIIVEVNEL